MSTAENMPRYKPQDALPQDDARLRCGSPPPPPPSSTPTPTRSAAAAARYLEHTRRDTLSTPGQPCLHHHTQGLPCVRRVVQGVVLLAHWLHVPSSTPTGSTIDNSNRDAQCARCAATASECCCQAHTSMALHTTNHDECEACAPVTYMHYL
jgi:hypothetical protein